MPRYPKNYAQIVQNYVNNGPKKYYNHDPNPAKNNNNKTFEERLIELEQRLTLLEGNKNSNK